MHCAIIQIETNRKQYLDLLLLADEQESMINRYWKRGDMFVLEDNGVKAVYVPSAIGFYQSYGFENSHRIENFFINNYNHLMIEKGMVLKDYNLFKVKHEFLTK